MNTYTVICQDRYLEKFNEIDLTGIGRYSKHVLKCLIRSQRSADIFCLVIGNIMLPRSFPCSIQPNLVVRDPRTLFVRTVGVFAPLLHYFLVALLESYLNLII